MSTIMFERIIKKYIVFVRVKATKRKNTKRRRKRRGECIVVARGLSAFRDR